MDIPRVRYAETPEGDVAYQVFGDGPDLLFGRPYPHNLEAEWENPAIERFYRRLGSFARVIVFDHQPAGLSGHGGVKIGFHLEGATSNSKAVLDAAGSERAFYIGIDPTATFLAWFVGAYPDRAAGLLMLDPAARFKRAHDYQFGLPEDVFARFVETLRANWGTGELLRLASGGRITDEALITSYGRLERLSFPPSMVRDLWNSPLMDIDLRGILPMISCPTVVIVHTDHGYILPDHGRYIARTMPNATLIERPGPYSMWWHDDVDHTLDRIEEFVTGSEPVATASGRVLATVLFTDIVGSTERAAALGDGRWRELLDVQGSVFERQLRRYDGRLVDTMGDGLLATFDGPARALRCGIAIRDDMRAVGLEIRAGVHTGEVELLGDDIGGLAVHIGARVMNAAQPGEVMASSVVKDLVAGAGLRFDDRGVHELKGVPDEWQLYAVAPGSSA